MRLSPDAPLVANSYLKLNPEGIRNMSPKPLLLGGLLLSLSIPYHAVQSGNLVEISPDNRAAFGIVTAAPVAAEATLSRRYPAKVAVPNRQLRVVSAPQNGVLEALLVAEGETVREGQELARLRSPDLLRTQNDYLEAWNRLQLAGSELRRNRKLSREGIVAERRLLESQAAYRQIETSLDRHRQRLELAGMSDKDIQILRRERKLDSSLPVRAPMDGVVLAQHVSTGQAVAAADPLYRIGRLTPLWLEVHVPVKRIAGVRESDPVRIPELDLSGRVITIGRMVHAEDQGVLVRAEIHHGASQLRPGQFVEVQLSEAAAEQDLWRVAEAAVLRNAGADYLFLVRAEGFEAVPVQVRAEEEGYKVVSGALDADERVVVRGIAALKAAWLGGAE